MSNLYRATITIPSDLHQKIRVQAAKQNKSLSSFISDILKKNVSVRPKTSLKLGKYSFTTSKKISREKIYEDYLKGKVSY